MTGWRRGVFALVRALRVRLRGRPFDDTPAVQEIRDPETGHVHAFVRPMTADELREARADAMRPAYRPRRWLDRGGARRWPDGRA